MFAAVDFLKASTADARTEVVAVHQLTAWRRPGQSDNSEAIIRSRLRFLAKEEKAASNQKAKSGTRIKV